MRGRLRIVDLGIFITGLASVLLLLDGHSSSGTGLALACFATRVLQMRLRRA